MRARPAHRLRARAQVQDLSDLRLLHLPSLTWLPPAAEHPPLRGGTNALVDVPDEASPGRRRLVVLGGMYSTPGAMPQFLDEAAEIVGLDK